MDEEGEEKRKRGRRQKTKDKRQRQGRRQIPCQIFWERTVDLDDMAMPGRVGSEPSVVLEALLLAQSVDARASQNDSDALPRCRSCLQL